MTNNLMYSTTTGDASAVNLFQEESANLIVDYYEEQPWCFVCSRPTDHRAEHDDLLDAGKITYDPELPLVLWVKE